MLENHKTGDNMSSLTNVVLQSSANLLHYEQSQIFETMKKDGQQTFAMGVCTFYRVIFLSGQMEWKGVTKAFWTQAAIVSGHLILSGVKPFAENYLREHKKEDTWKVRGVKLVCKLADLHELLVKHSETLINVVACVAYVASIAFGSVLTGGLGLAGLLLITLKKRGYIHAAMDRLLAPLFIVAGLNLSVTMSMNIPLRILFATAYTIAFLSYVKGTIDPFAGLHQIPIRTPEEWRKISFNKDYGFSVNRTYIYAPEVSRIFPPELEKEAETLDAKTLLDELDKAIKEEQIKLTKEEEEGIDDIKSATLTGKAKDNAPTDVEQFQKVIKILLKTILDDRANRARRIQKELIPLGLSCIEGWTRDVENIINPDSKDYKWAVHHQLSKLRGIEVLKAVEKVKIVTVICGGENNVHLVNGIEATLWHRLRSWRGVAYKTLNPPNIVEAYVVKKILTKQPDAIGKRDIAYAGLKSLFGNSELQALLLIWIKLFYDAERHFDDVEGIVKTVYDAIRPTYIKAKDNRMEERRTLSWQTIQMWIGEVEGRTGLKLLKDDNTYNESYIEKNLQGHSYLTEAGVRLLLTDMGILTPT